MEQIHSLATSESTLREKPTNRILNKKVISVTTPNRIEQVEIMKYNDDDSIHSTTVIIKVKNDLTKSVEHIPFKLFNTERRTFVETIGGINDEK